MKKIRYSVLLLILLTFISCAKAVKPYSSREPHLKIAVRHKADAINITSTGRYKIVSTNGMLLLSRGDETTVRRSGNNPIIEINQSKRIKKIFYPVKFKPVSGHLNLNGVPYRGEIWVIKDADNYLLAINYINMEDYLRGVVPAEIGALDKSRIEACKAQAVAARTYALSHIGMHYDMGYDLECTVSDQVYKGIRIEHPVTDLAVLQTAGMIAMYKGRPIEAKYHSTCGGYTSANEYAWGGTPLPYLRSIKDGGGCLFWQYYYCGQSPHFDWEHKFRKNDFYRLLSINLSRIEGKDITVKRIRVGKRDSGGRVIALYLYDNRSQRHTVSGLNIRKIFSGVNAPGNFLRSRAFDIETGWSYVVIKGSGFGHGVGMCQYGAMEMAARGKSYSDILKHYYRGIELRRLY